jgi:hypothetical protein
MPPADVQGQPSRGPLLGLFLTILALMFFVLVLIFISGGFFLYVVAACLGLVAWCGFHYVLWGRAMSHSVAGEREEELLRQRAAEDWDEVPRASRADGIRRP